MMEPVESNEASPEAKRSALTAIIHLPKQFNHWLVRYPTSPRRLLVIWVASALIMSLIITLALSLANPHLRFRANWVLWSIEYPVLFTLLQAPRNYRVARRLAGLGPDLLSRLARIIDRALVSLGIGAIAATVLWFGAVHGGTALALFPIFSTIVFGMSMLLLELSEGTSRPRLLKWRYMPMRSFLSCDDDERRLVKFALGVIFLLKRSITPLEFWSRWTARTRSAVIEWVWLLMSLGSGFVAMTAILAPHCMTRTNQIGFPLAGMAILVAVFMIKGIFVVRSLGRIVR